MSSTAAGTKPDHTETASRPSITQVAALISEAVGAGPIGLLLDDEIVSLAGFAEELGRQADALRVQLAGEIDARATVDFGEGSLASRLGCRNSTELLQRVTLVSASTAAKRFALARATRPEVGFSGHIIPPQFPAVAAALAEHAIQCESAEIITRTLGRLPHHVSVADLAYAERCLVAAACGSTPPDGTEAALPEHADNIRVMGQAWAAALDQDGPEPDFDEQHQRRFFRLGREKHGLVPLHGSVLPEVAATIGRLFDAINSPRAGLTPGGSADLAARGSERAATDGAETGGSPSASRVHFVETDTANARNAEDAGNGASVGDAAHFSGAAGGPAPGDRRTPDQKRHDAFAVIAHAASGHEDMPVLGGAPVTVLIQVEEAQLHSGRGTAWLHGHDGAPAPLSLSGVQHSTCTGATQRVMQNRDGRIIELGNLQRIFTSHQRRAIALRDGGCVIPGCTVPATWCEIHHVVEHAQGGHTHTDNGATLCWYHHRSLGTSGWAIRMRDGTPETQAPKWIDQSQRWRKARPPLRPPGIEQRHRPAV